MSFTRRIARLVPPRTRIARRYNSTSTSAPQLDNVQPTFTQKPPIWVRFAWPIIFANALLMGSAIDITWNHWATLVKDLEAVAEKNKQDAAQLRPGSSSNGQDTKSQQESYHWEPRPSWQRAAFCGIYGMGWAVSTAYLLKYRQTFVTSLRFFRAPKGISVTTATETSTASIPTMTTPESISGSKPKFHRFVHITTASHPGGRTLPLSELTIQDGRNETEMVIRMSGVQGGNKRRREYWYIGLTEAVVNGALYSAEGARERILGAWNGSGVVEKKQQLGGGWKSGPVIQSRAL